MFEIKAKFYLPVVLRKRAGKEKIVWAEIDV